MTPDQENRLLDVAELMLKELKIIRNTLLYQYKIDKATAHILADSAHDEFKKQIFARHVFRQADANLDEKAPAENQEIILSREKFNNAEIECNSKDVAGLVRWESGICGITAYSFNKADSIDRLFIKLNDFCHKVQDAKNISAADKKICNYLMEELGLQN